MTFKHVIQKNAEHLAALHRRTRELLKQRDRSSEDYALWTAACESFRNHYSPLAFIGGVETVRERLRAGDEEAIEYALDFLDVRPYFFRSGYMYKDFMRVLRNCPLSEAQKKRYDILRRDYDEYRKERRAR